MILYGKNPVLEALKANKRLVTVYILKNNESLLKPYLKLIDELIIVDNQKMVSMYGNKTQGIVAITKEYQYANYNQVINDLSSKEDVTLVLLDGLEDPHNLGAILRSADATLVDAIIIPKNRSVRLNETVAKVSTGAIEHVDVIEVTNLRMTIDNLKKLGYWIVGLELDGSTDYREQDYHGKIAVVVGSEGKGISKLVKESCDFLVRIPMYGKVNSLNASVSTALILYQILTNRGK